MAKKIASYLSGIKFDRKLLNSWQARYLRNIRIPVLLIITITTLGLYAFVTIPRRVNPEIKIPIVVVNTVLPGANPEDVESLVTIPLERAMGNVAGLDTMQSTSRDSSSTIVLTFISTVEVNEAKSDVQNLVDSVGDLPEDAVTPNVQAVDFERQPVWTFAVTTELDETSLMRFSEYLQDRLEEAPRVDRVLTSGIEEQNVEVVVETEKAADFGLNPIQISQLVRSSLNSFPAGSVNSDSSTFSVTINKDITTVEDIRNILIKVDNTSIPLGDIANVSIRSKGTQAPTYYGSDETGVTRAVQFFVYRKKNADIDAAYKDAQKVVDQVIPEYGNQFQVVTVMNTAEEITDQFADLFVEFRNTIILIFILLVVFLGLRQAIIASLTVPLTFLASFSIINALGLTLNFLTTFSFLLTLGLLIDDTIVSVAAMTRYHRTGKFTPYETGILVWRDFIVPLWSTTITTIWAFVPLLLSTGIIGEFIKSIPIVVTVTMLSSTTIAVLITIPLMIVFLNPRLPRRVQILFIILGVVALILSFAYFLPRNALMPITIAVSLAMLAVGVFIRREFKNVYQKFKRRYKKTQIFVSRIGRYIDDGVINIEILSNKYRNIINAVLSSKGARVKTIWMIAIFAVVGYLLVPLGFVKNEFFPKSDYDLIYVSVELPTGTKNEIVTREAVSLLEDLRKDTRIEYIVAEVGQSVSGEGGREGSTENILYTIHLPKPDKRNYTSIDYAQELRNRYLAYPKGKLSVVEMSGGPPAGADVQVKLLGEDLGVLDQYADNIVAYLNQQDGLNNIEKSLKQGTSKVVFEPDHAKLIAEEVTIDQVGLWLRTYASGFSLDSLRIGDREDDIVFKISSYDAQSLTDLATIQIPVRNNTIPLLSLGKLRVEANPTTISREDQKRTISITAGVAQGYSVSEQNAKLLEFVESLDLPTGYTWTTGGVNEENQKSVQSILQAMVISFLLIVITMVLEFGSFRQSFIAMLLIPITIASVFYVFAITNTPLSFAALIGILALFGIVVTHAIVVMEKINENRAHGLSLQDAIADASANRLEPVLLTSLTTIVGLIPITIADPFWRGLGGAIIAGLLFSGIIKLFFIPVMYYNFYHIGSKKRR